MRKTNLNQDKKVVYKDSLVKKVDVGGKIYEMSYTLIDGVEIVNSFKPSQPKG